MPTAIRRAAAIHIARLEASVEEVVQVESPLFTAATKRRALDPARRRRHVRRCGWAHADPETFLSVYSTSIATTHGHLPRK
jgi:hypothetical protein